MGTVLVIVAVVAILGLIINIAVLKARLAGFREAQQQMNNVNYGIGPGYDLLRTLAVIGFIAVCIVCCFLGAAVSALAQ